MYAAMAQPPAAHAPCISLSLVVPCSRSTALDTVCRHAPATSIAITGHLPPATSPHDHEYSTSRGHAPQQGYTSAVKLLQHAYWCELLHTSMLHCSSVRLTATHAALQLCTSHCNKRHSRKLGIKVDAQPTGQTKMRCTESARDAPCCTVVLLHIALSNSLMVPYVPKHAVALPSPLSHHCLKPPPLHCCCCSASVAELSTPQRSRHPQHLTCTALRPLMRRP
jgi:hypothetical protein